MTFTYNTKKIESTDGNKKSGFEKFKNFVKEKSFLVAVPLVLTFSTPLYADKNMIKYEVEETEREIEIRINQKMKNAYLDFKDNKIDRKELEVRVFKELYEQVKENDFPSTKLSHAVNEIIGIMEGMDLNREGKKPVIIKKKETLKPKPKVKVQVTKEDVENFSKNLNELEQLSNEELVTSVTLFEDVDSLEFVVNKDIKKLNGALIKLEEQYNNGQDKIVIEEYNLEVENTYDGATLIIESLINEWSAINSFFRTEMDSILEDIDSCTVCDNTTLLHNTLENLVYEINVKRKLIKEFIDKNELIKENKVVENSDEDLETLINENKIENDNIIEKPEVNDRYKSVSRFYTGLDFTRQVNTLPSMDAKGLDSNLLDIEMGNSFRIKSIGIDAIVGYSAELNYFKTNINEYRKDYGNDVAYHSPESHLAKMLVGFSYNTKYIHASLLAGYKVGKLYTSNPLGRKEHYPLLSFKLGLYENQHTEIKVETPLSFNYGQNLSASIEHISKYVVFDSNVTFSNQPSIFKTDDGNIIRDTYSVVNNNNLLGVSLYPFKGNDKTIVSPTLFVVSSFNHLNADNLQKVMAWSVGPGVGLNVMLNENPFLMFGYGYGMGKYNSKYTNLENNSGYKLNSFYSTHNVFVKMFAPITENWKAVGEFSLVRGDGKGVGNIKSPLNDYSKFLLMFTYTY